MAVEAIKHVTQSGEYNAGGKFKWGPSPALTPTLLLYSAFEKVPFRTTYLMKQRKDCALCSANPSVTRQSLDSGSMDYEVFCGLRAPINILPDYRRISAQTFNDQVRSCSECFDLNDPDDDDESPRKSPSINSYILVDVRESQDFAMCRIAGSVNLPFSLIERAMRGTPQSDDSWDTPEFDMYRKVEDVIILDVDVYFICRYGNDSQMAVQHFVDMVGEPSKIMDVEGGLRAWSKVDRTFPEY